MDDANASGKTVAKVVAVPQTCLMLGDLSKPDKVIPLQSCILIAVSAVDLPLGCNLTSRRKLHPFGSCFTHIDCDKGIYWVRRGRIAPIKLKQRQGHIQIWPNVPFRTDFIICEFLGRQILLGDRQCQKLVAGPWQE